MIRINIPRVKGCFALAAVLAGTLSGRAQNWVQWKSVEGGNGHYYALTPVATNWAAAEALAVSWGGTLATITSEAEQKFINDTFLTGALEHRPVWIGLMDKAAKKGPWKLKLGPVKVEIGDAPKPSYNQWVTGEPINYQNWKPGQPDNCGGNEHYGVINWFDSDSPPRGIKGDWNDAPLDGTRGFGGTTDGPYFGLVERDFDPRLPVPKKFAVSPMNIVLVILATSALIILLVRFQRKKKAAA